MMILIKGGIIVNSDSVQKADILIENEIISKIGYIDEISFSAAKVLHRENQYIFPGFIDFHVHLDDQIGEFYIADTYSSGTEKAIKNGITTIMSFITQSKDNSLIGSIQHALSKVVSNTHCDVGYHLTPTKFGENDWQIISKLIDKGFSSFKFYTTYKKAGIFADYSMIEKFMKRFQHKNIRILVHCEDDNILQEAALNHAKESFLYHSKSRPKSAEIKAVKEMIQLSQKYQIAVHIVHVTTAESVKLLTDAKKTAPITFETGMQYLYFDESVYEREDANYLFCTPSFHDKNNTEQMKKLAISGKFDIFATDHCPFTKKDKDKYKSDQDKIPNGLPGLSYLAKLTANLFDDLSDKNISLICEKLSTNPAKLIGQYPQKGIIDIGARADLVICDFNGDEEISNNDEIYTPFQGFKTKLNINDVIFKGKHKYKKDKKFDNKKTGTIIYEGLELD